MKLYSIETGNIKFDGGAMFGVVPKSMWVKKYPADENNMTNWAMRALLIVEGERRVLVDTGMGDKLNQDYLKHFYPNGDANLKDSLKDIGFQPEDITDVVLTHLHFDHCGGSTSYDENNTAVPTFSNATYHISKAQWEWALSPNSREKASFLEENILPLKKSGQLNLIDKPGFLFPWMELRFFNGHTEGQMIPFVNYNGRTLVYTADLLPSVAHFSIPWVMAYDVKPLETLKEKESFLKEAYSNGYILFFEHDLYTECCSLKNTPKGIRENEVFKLKQINSYFFLIGE